MCDVRDFLKWAYAEVEGWDAFGAERLDDVEVDVVEGAFGGGGEVSQNGECVAGALAFFVYRVEDGIADGAIGNFGDEDSDAWFWVEFVGSGEEG